MNTFKNSISSRVLLVLALLGLGQQPIKADIHDRIEYKVNRNQRLLEIINGEVIDLLECTCKCTAILPKDFEDEAGNLTQTYVITEPGSYCLGADINFAPETDFTPAIKILSDNVNLDLSGFRLNQSNSTSDVYGIQIGQGYNYDDANFVLKNINIFNGSITNFTGIGIFCYNGSFDADGENGVPFESLEFTNLNILDCGQNPSFDFASGINLDSSIISGILREDRFPVAYKNVIIENSNVNRCKGTAAINIYTGDNIIFKDTQANESISTVSIFDPAAYFILARNLQMYNCQGNNTKSLDPEYFGQVGSFFQFCINVYMKDCQFNDTFGESSFIVNTNLSLSQNFVAEDCQFNNNRGGELASIVAGVHMSESFEQSNGNGLKFINCQFNGASVSPTNTNVGSSFFVCGFTAITFRNIIFENCQACNMHALNSNLFSVTGFLVGSFTKIIPFYANHQNISFVDCTVSDLEGQNRVIGFDAGPETGQRVVGQQTIQTNYVFENCIAERIHSKAPESVAIGISCFPILDLPVIRTISDTVNVFIKNCRISDVRSNPTTPSANSAGITLGSVQHPVLEENNISDCDRGILFTGIGLVTPADRFQLATSLDNALATPPVMIDLTGNTTYSVGTARQRDRTVTGVGTTFISDMIGGTIQFGSVSDTGDQTLDIVTATVGAPFTSDMVGDTITFPNSAYSAYIVTYLGPTSVQVDTTLPNPLLPQSFTVNLGITPITAVNVGLQTLTVSRSNNLFLNPQNYTITYGFPTGGAQSFNNITNGMNILITPSSTTVDFTRDLLVSPTSQNTLGWKAGDQILYLNNGFGNIPDLITTTTYYLINYVPGFCDRGVVQNNEVDNCSITGYEENRPNSTGATGPLGASTTSAWINNVAMDNGPTGLVTDATNYDITWFPGLPPIDSGFVGGPYPAPGNKYYNLSLLP